MRGTDRARPTGRWGPGPSRPGARDDPPESGDREGVTMETLGLTVEDLKELPLRAIAAWAVRCARRVQPLIPPPEGRPETDRPRAVVEAALRMAEDFARGAVPRL